jgi:hypothetical protein
MVSVDMAVRFNEVIHDDILLQSSSTIFTFGDGKVITIWDPVDETPNYPPYVFAVDSPFALGQDLNNNLAKDWVTSCGSNSSAGVACS